MEGVLDLGSGQFAAQPRASDLPRSGYRRSKTGCLNCRLRRKKCDEHRLVCQACQRNHLICRWPDGDDAAALVQRRDWAQSSIVPRSRIVESPGDLDERTRRLRLFDTPPCVAPSLWPQLPNMPGSQRLLDFYVNVTAAQLSTRVSSENPYLTCLLPLATEDSGILHIILALGASHLSCSDASLAVAARTYYGIALRAAKYRITEAATTGSSSSRIARLLAFLLMLCHFETVDGDMNGAIGHHLRACSSLLSQSLLVLNSSSPSLGPFIIEQFCYFYTVATHVGLTTSSPPPEPPVLVDELSQLVPSLMRQSNFYGFMLGCSHGLFTFIPQIAQFAARGAQTTPRFDQQSLKDEFESLDQKIMTWQYPPDGAFREEERTSGRIYQLTLLIYLRIAMSGPGRPPHHIQSQISQLAEEFLHHLPSLHPDSTAWTTLLWPVLMVGSCLEDPEEQQYLTNILRALRRSWPMFTPDRVLSVLSWTWERAPNDESYGPFGVHNVMKKHGVKISLG